MILSVWYAEVLQLYYYLSVYYVHVHCILLGWYKMMTHGYLIQTCLAMCISVVVTSYIMHIAVSLKKKFELDPIC